MKGGTVMMTSRVVHEADAVSLQIGNLVKDARCLQGIAVRGEVKNHREVNGHHFFDLCGSNSAIACVAWKSVHLSAAPTGVVVLTLRGASWDARRGRLQLVAYECEAVSAELEINRVRAMLRDSLVREGLLPRQARPLPDVPSHLAIVTSSESAAESDMLQGRHERWANLRTTCLHTRVQGCDAWRGVVASLDAIALLRPPVDLVICARGGGSTTELSGVFDHEQVVRAILRAAVPVICAVGHECDRHLAEEAADYRAKTPSSAVELGIPRKLDLAEGVHGTARTLRAAAIQRAVETRRSLLPLEQKLCQIASAASERARTHLRLLQQSFQSAMIAGSKCIDAGARQLETALQLQIVATRAQAAMRLTLLCRGAQQRARDLAVGLEDQRADISRLTLAVQQASAQRRAQHAAIILALTIALQSAADRAVLSSRAPHDRLRLQIRSAATLLVARRSLKQLHWQVAGRSCASLNLSRSILEQRREELQTKGSDVRRNHMIAIARLRDDLLRAQSPRKRSWPQVFSAEKEAQEELRYAHACTVGQSICIRLADGEVVAVVKRIKLDSL